MKAVRNSFDGTRRNDPTFGVVVEGRGRIPGGAGRETTFNTPALPNNNQDENIISFLQFVAMVLPVPPLQESLIAYTFFAMMWRTGRRYHTHAAINRTRGRTDAMFLISFQKRLRALRRS
jgi:hypothetical protein